MPREYSRSLRVGEQIQRELAVLIQQEVKDPRIGMVTVSAVEVSHDLSHAKVYVTFLDNDTNIDEHLKVLNHAAGYLRHELAQRLSLKIIPGLRFLYDASIEQGARLSSLIDAAVRMDDHNVEESQSKE